MKVPASFIVAIVILSVIGWMYYYSHQVVPDQLAKQVADAPLVEPSQLAKFSGINRLVKCHLFTGGDAAPETKFYFERLCQEHKFRNSSSTLHWRTLRREPENLVLYSKNKDTQVSLTADLIDDDYLPSDYFDSDNEQLDAIIPGKWRSKILHSGGRRLRVTNLPVNTEVLVAGWVVPSEQGVKITTFGSGGFAHKVIVSADSLDTLLARLRVPVDSTRRQN
jgi:hypothetical protein